MIRGSKVSTVYTIENVKLFYLFCLFIALLQIIFCFSTMKILQNVFEGIVKLCHVA